MLVIGCTVSLMSWGRGCCTQPWEYCGASSAASVELGAVGRWEASVTGQGVPQSVCCHWGWAEQRGVAPPEHLSQAVADTGGLCSAVLTGQGCALQTLQVFELLMSGTELLVIHTASCRLTWRGTDSSGTAILLSEELQAPSVALEELYSVKMQCRNQSQQIPEDAFGTY